MGRRGNPLRNASPRVAGSPSRSARRAPRDTPAPPSPDAAAGPALPQGAADRAAFAGLHAAEARVAEPLWGALDRALGVDWHGVVPGLRERAGDRLAAAWVRAHGAAIPAERAPLAVLLAVLPDDLGEARILVARALGPDPARALLNKVGAAPITQAAYARVRLEPEGLTPAAACRRLLGGGHASEGGSAPAPAAAPARASARVWIEDVLAGFLRAAERAAFAFAPPAVPVPAYRDAGAAVPSVRHLALPCGDAHVYVAGAVEAGALILRVVALDADGAACPDVEVSVGPVTGPWVVGRSDRHGVITALRCEATGGGGAWELRVQAGPHASRLSWAVPA